MHNLIDFPRSRVAAAALLACALAGLGAAARAAGPAQPRWEVRDLGGLGEPGFVTQEAFAYGLNNRGEVVGRVFGQAAGDAAAGNVAFVWRNGTMQRIPLAPSGRPISGPSSAAAINDAGAIAGFAYSAAGTPRPVGILAKPEGFTMVHDPYDYLDSGRGSAYAVAANGAWAGSTFASDAGLPRSTAWRIGADGLVYTLAPLGLGRFAYARGINASEVVVGGALTVQSSGIVDDSRALRWDAAGNASMLPSLGGNFDLALAIDDAGTIVGTSNSQAVKWENGQVITLAGTPSGSQANAISRNGWIVGNVANGPTSAAWLNLPGNQTLQAIALPGVAGSGWTSLDEANSVNDRGQFVGYGRRSDVAGNRAYLATLATTVWEGSSGGSFEDAANWSYRLRPTDAQHVVIDPTRATTVFGPAQTMEVRRVGVGGASDGGGGLATLQMVGGTLVARDAGEDSARWRGMQITGRGLLAGEGRIVIGDLPGRALWNDGTVRVDDLRVEGVFVNRGLVAGQWSGSRIAAGFFNNLGANPDDGTTLGTLRVQTGERLHVDAVLRNSGDIVVFGGQFSHRGQFTNTSFNDAAGRTSTGRVLAQDAWLDFQSGATLNGGQLVFSAGNSNVFGPLLLRKSEANGRGGQIIVTGRSQASFYGEVEVQSGAELRVSAGSVASFLGAVRQRSGALFTGTGTKFYEGGLSIGNSPGIGADEGDVVFGGSNVYLAEIGGTEPGSGHDQLIVGGHLTFGGTLQLVSWAGYAGAVGDRYDLFDWGTSEGRFDTIDTSGLRLAGGAVLDFSRLYLDGTVGVTAVPEPGTWALWLAGVVAVGGIARRRGTRKI